MMATPLKAATGASHGLEFRRSALLREVERRNQIVARDADKAASSIVDAEFTEVED